MHADRQALGTLRWLTWKAGSLLYAGLGRALFRHQVDGREALPDGGYLLLGNHTSAPDNLWVAGPVGRPTHIMTSAAMFRNPVAGALLRFVNCFPKEVGARDSGSMDAVASLLERGQIVQMMPEGVRTWDGRRMPIRAGIGKLVADQRAAVVVCRTKTGHLWWPRWGSWPRWVPVCTEYARVGPWPEGTAPDRIAADIVAALEIPANPTPPGCWGVRLAEGLETYLWACPSCFALCSTWSRDSTFGCAACEATWTVTAHQRLEGTPSLWLREAWDRIEAHFGPLPRQSDAHALLDEGEVVDARTSRLLGSGPMALHDADLRVGDWMLPLASVRSVTMDAGNVLMIRAEQGSLQVRPNGSTWMWSCFLTPRIRQ